MDKASNEPAVEAAGVDQTAGSLYEALDPAMFEKGVKVPILRDVAGNPARQWAAWFRRVYPPQVIPTQFAAAIGRSRSVVYKWLCGDYVPDVGSWPDIAEQCGLGRNPWALCPTPEFLTEIGVEANGAAGLPPDVAPIVRKKLTRPRILDKRKRRRAGRKTRRRARAAG